MPPTLICPDTGVREGTVLDKKYVVVLYETYRARTFWMPPTLICPDRHGQGKAQEGARLKVSS